MFGLEQAQREGRASSRCADGRGVAAMRRFVADGTEAVVLQFGRGLLDLFAG